jgi:hypothetical protein
MYSASEVEKEIEFLASDVSCKSCCLSIQLSPATLAGSSAHFMFTACKLPSQFVPRTSHVLTGRWLVEKASSYKIFVGKNLNVKDNLGDLITDGKERGGEVRAMRLQVLHK